MVRSHIWLSYGLRSVVLIAFAISGCSSEEQIIRYEVDRDEATDSNEHTPAKPHHAAPAAASVKLSYDTPEGWKPGEVRGMRKAAFRVEDGDRKVEITVIDMPAAVGRMLLDNVNEWRRQLQLEAIARAELQETVRPIEVAGEQGHYVELVGPEDAESRRAILAVVAIHGAKSWFFKLLGDAELALQEKERFEAFVKSVKFETPAESPAVARKEASGKDSPPAAVPHGTSPPVVPKRVKMQVECDTPEGWTVGEVQGIRKAVFHVKDGDQAVEISATDFPAAIGQLMMPNVNRWCKQIQRDEMTEEELAQMVSPIQVAGVQGHYVELLGPEDAERRLAILSVVVVSEGKAWFLKMKGDAELASREKERFKEFLESVKFTVAEAPTEETTAKKPAPKEVTAKEAPAEEAAAEKPAPKEAPAEEAAAEKPAPKEAPAEEAAAEKPAPKEAPTEEATTGKPLPKETTAEENPSEEAANEGVGAKGASDDE
ncbi:MAG: hypothetical protein ISR77_24935 [Pirellulaceae bacterium]|nr:hypothetical protein [Pirellulaceae bacterium]